MNETTRNLNEGLFPMTDGRSAINALLGPVMDAPARMRTNRSNDGRAFQKEIEMTCGGYQSNRVATIRKVDPPTRLIGGGKTERRVMFLPNPFLDFCGTWTARHGRALFFEAKSTGTHRLPLGSGGLTETQQNAMHVWRRACAATFVIWQWSGRCCLFTPEMFPVDGARSLVFENGLPVPRGTGSIIWDFLPVVAAKIWPAADVPIQKNGEFVA
jgi:hypothetical protein